MTRINYEDNSGAPNYVYLKWAPFTLVPHWNWRAQADYGTFGDGGYRYCTTPQATRCVKIAWEVKAFAYTQAVPAGDLEVGWFGSLRDLKEDGGSGLRYMRNRYLDPATGRFTQEDPIGLAGGLNLYGFANGDPVNFSDPFGLNPCRNRFVNFTGAQARCALAGRACGNAHRGGGHDDLGHRERRSASGFRWTFGVGWEDWQYVSRASSRSSAGGRRGPGGTWSN
jgi:RHS repeat-associated protein